MQIFKVQILTPEKKLFEGEVEEASLPVKDGQVQFLAYHSAYLGILKPGEIIVQSEKDADSKKTFKVEHGIVEFKNNKLKILI